MTFIKNTLKLTLVLYICVALTGVYVLSASARITPKETEEETTLITIKKGDTLWDLCQEYLKDPTKWPELKKYNDFSNPDLIYPGERLRIPVSLAKDMGEDLNDEGRNLNDELAASNEEAKATKELLENAEKELKKLMEDLKKIQSKVAALEKELKSKDMQLKEAEKVSSEALTSIVRIELATTQEALQKKLNQVNRNVNGLEKLITEKNSAIEAIKGKIASIEQNNENLLKQIEMNQEALKELNIYLKNAKGIHEEPSSTKRTLAFVTTVAAGVGWFVLSSIGGRSGE